ncbi:MAG: type II secretion system F family protein, partial [Gemmatimonadales bacterium]
RERRGRRRGLLAEWGGAMTLYRYRAARSDGATLSGFLPAADAGEARATLSGRGLYPLALDPVEDFEGRRRPARRADLAIVFQSLAALTQAGVPVERAAAASEPLASGPLREALEAIRQDLKEGLTLAQALERTRGLVPPLVIGMIRAGERGSQLAQALTQVARELEREAELSGRVRQALAYPLVLCVAGAFSVGIISTVVVPRFAEILGDVGQQLPPATRLLLGMSDLVSRFGLVILAGIAVLGAALVEWARRPRGRLMLAGWLLEFPVVGAIRGSLATARLCRALGAMLSAGMPLLPALDGAHEAAGDAAIGLRLRAARERVAQGEPLAASLERERVLTPSALQLLAVGEASGQVALMADRAATLASQEAERGLKTLVSLLEPGLVILFGGLVAFVAAALLQAVYSVRPGGF